MANLKTQKSLSPYLHLSPSISIFFISLSLLFFATPVFAEKFTAQNAADFATKANTQIGAEDVEVTVVAANIAKGVFSIGGIIFFLLVFYGGYTWLMARGEEEQVQKAQNIIIGAIIGLFIMVGSYAITNFVLDKMINKTGGSTATNAPSDTGDTSPWGCCLDKFEFEGSVLDIGNTEHWLSSIEHKKTCEEVICKSCSNGDQICGSGPEYCLFYEKITNPDDCDALKSKD